MQLEILGNASKFQNRVTPTPTNQVPIFSDRLNVCTDFIGAEWNGIGKKVAYLHRAVVI